jgi:hypothetical protein
MAGNKRQRITQRHHRRRTRARREPQRTSFSELAKRQHDIGRSAKRAVQIRSDRDHRNADPLEQRYQTDNLFGCAAVGKHESNIAARDATEVTVQRLGRMQEVASATGRTECGGNFLSDQAGLAHAQHDHISLAVDNPLHRVDKVCIKAIGEVGQCVGFVVHDLTPHSQLVRFLTYSLPSGS